MPRAPDRCTHNYSRHGTTSLFAVLDLASAFVIGKWYRHHRAAESLNFLKDKAVAIYSVLVLSREAMP
jgi:hypothetical protein